MPPPMTTFAGGVNPFGGYKEGWTESLRKRLRDAIFRHNECSLEELLNEIGAPRSSVSAALTYLTQQAVVSRHLVLKPKVPLKRGRRTVYVYRLVS